jgi:hypothetical protein
MAANNPNTPQQEEPADKVKCTQCKGKKTFLCTTYGPHCPVKCRHCKGTGVEPEEPAAEAISTDELIDSLLLVGEHTYDPQAADRLASQKAEIWRLKQELRATNKGVERAAKVNEGFSVLLKDRLASQQQSMEKVVEHLNVLLTRNLEEYHTTHSYKNNTVLINKALKELEK